MLQKFNQAKVEIDCADCDYHRNIYYRWPTGRKLPSLTENARETVEGSQAMVEKEHNPLGHNIVYKITDRKVVEVEDPKKFEGPKL